MVQIPFLGSTHLPVGHRDRLAAGTLAPSFSPFCQTTSLLLPPAGWAPPPPLPDRSPARSAAVWPGVAWLALCVAGLGVEVGNRRGATA